MSREIKFRGQVLGTTRWVVGFFCKDFTGDCFITDGKDTHQVNKNSIGQFTGLKDKNGVEIYEGDIVAIELIKNFKPYYDLHLVVEWKEYKTGFVGWSQFSPVEKFIIVGNIHETPELLTHE